MLPLSITPDITSKGLRTLAPWSVIRLQMSPSPCRSVRTFTVNSHRLSIFSPPRPTYRCPFTEPSDGFKSIFGQSSGFTTDSLAPESTVISRYRPCSPSVATRLLWMDDGHVANCDCVPVHLVRPLSVIGVVARSVFSFTGDVILWRFHWQTLVLFPASCTLNRQESSLRGNLSHRVQFSVRFVFKDPFVATRRTVLASHPNNQGMTLRLGGLHCKVSETSRKTSLSS